MKTTATNHRKPKRSKQLETRKNVWLRRDLFELVNKSRGAVPIQHHLDTLVESALRQRRLLPPLTEQSAPVTEQPAA